MTLREKNVFQALADLEIHIISSIPISGTIPLKELQSYGVAVHIGSTMSMILGLLWRRFFTRKAGALFRDFAVKVRKT